LADFQVCSAYSKHAQVQFIPVSGLHGDNVAEPSGNLGRWSGPTLLQALDDIQPARRPLSVNRPLRVPVKYLPTLVLLLCK
jgi:translation elongation factor EF-1alpha